MGTKKKVANGSIDATSAMAVDSAPAGSSAYAALSFNDVLEDLSSRFIVNLPAEEQASIQRICFQVEQAHWFYEDFLRPLNPSLPSFALRRFSSYLLHTAALTVPLIQRYISNASTHESQQGLEAAFDEFMKYKTRVPVCGAVMLNTKLDKCILVKGWKSSAAWGFPKGKINQQETERDCAVREVLEETGFDCGPYLAADSRDFMELTMREQKIRLYIVPGVEEDVQFETQTRKEISKIDWFKLSDLPTWKKNKVPPQGMGGKFYLISPFIGKLKQWIGENRGRYVHGAHAAAAVSYAGEEEGASGELVPGEGSGVDERSNDLKNLLGLAQAPTTILPDVDGKGPQMIEERGDDRSRQLLDLLRGAPLSEHTPGTPQSIHQTATAAPIQQLDEREKGTASLLAALNAGAGKADLVDVGAPVHTGTSGASGDDGSALLALLNGAGSSQQAAAPQSSTLLHAPQAQRTVQAQSLLNLISPSTSLSFSNAQQAGPPPAEQHRAAPSAWEQSIPTASFDDAKESERAQKRDLLLSNMMSSKVSFQSRQATLPPPQQQQQPLSPPLSQDQRAREFRFPPPPPPLPQTTQNGPQNGNLLAMLNGGPSQPAANPGQTHPTFTHAPPSQQPANPLLTLLNNANAPPPSAHQMPTSGPTYGHYPAMSPSWGPPPPPPQGAYYASPPPPSLPGHYGPGNASYPIHLQSPPPGHHGAAFGASPPPPMPPSGGPYQTGFPGYPAFMPPHMQQQHGGHATPSALHQQHPYLPPPPPPPPYGHAPAPHPGLAQ